MRPILRELTGTLVSAAVLLGLGLYAYWRLKKDAAAVVPSLPEVATATKQIILGAPSAAASILKGENESGYITTEQQRAMAAAALERKRRITAAAR